MQNTPRVDGPPRAKRKRGLYQSTIIIAHVKPAMADGREAPRQVSEQKWTTLWMDVGRLPLTGIRKILYFYYIQMARPRAGAVKQRH